MDGSYVYQLGFVVVILSTTRPTYLPTYYDQTEIPLTTYHHEHP